jgi:hypothetical protein
MVSDRLPQTAPRRRFGPPLFLSGIISGDGVILGDSLAVNPKAMKLMALTLRLAPKFCIWKEPM